MAVSIVIGGQFGSEGKGKVAYFWTKENKADAVVRVGGSNSGHTIYKNGEKIIFRMLPTSCIMDGVVSVLPAGSYIDMQVLLDEINRCHIEQEFLWIDENAVIIEDFYKDAELQEGLRESIGSTLSGTGAALQARIKRDKRQRVKMAKDEPLLKMYLKDTKQELRNLLNIGKNIVIEGTQGYGLSNYHSKCYPYATSRDTTAAGFLAETGLSPLDVTHVIMVIRTFPIRVAGESGPLEQEIDWGIVSKESGAKNYFEEKTSVTQNVRRVARFDASAVKAAIQANNPNVIVLNHMDYIDYNNKDSEILTEKQLMFLKRIETEIGQKVNYYGNGEMSFVAL